MCFLRDMILISEYLWLQQKYTMAHTGYFFRKKLEGWGSNRAQGWQSSRLAVRLATDRRIEQVHPP